MFFCIMGVTKNVRVCMERQLKENLKFKRKLEASGYTK